jgi:hypothetical protein
MWNGRPEFTQHQLNLGNDAQGSDRSTEAYTLKLLPATRRIVLKKLLAKAIPSFV